MTGQSQRYFHSCCFAATYWRLPVEYFAESENPDIFMGGRARLRSTVILSHGCDEALFYCLMCGKPVVSPARLLPFSVGIVNIGHYPAVPPEGGTEKARRDAGAPS